MTLSAELMLADQETGEYLENLDASTNDQYSENNPFDQNKNQYLQDSINERNNPIAQHGDQFLRDSMNNRNNLVRRYGKFNDRNDIVNNPFYATHGPISMRTLYEW